MSRSAATTSPAAKTRQIASVRRIAAIALLAAAPLGSAGEGASPEPDALWQIVSTCVDRGDRPYCECPAFGLSCCRTRDTPDRDVVWDLTEDFVAIRDLVMCGCPAGFVAGLALPRARVTGIEDPRRPEGIWPFAWRIARERIADEREIGLVINPADERTQDQMHVHLLRLDSEVRAGLDAQPAILPAGTSAIELPDLGAVFAAVEARVGRSIADRGILVAKRGGTSGFLALVTDRSSPQAFTQNQCLR